LFKAYHDQTALLVYSYM